MPYRREGEMVLEAWGDAERRLTAAPAGSDGERDATADLMRLLDECGRSIALAREHRRPEPAPFPGLDGEPAEGRSLTDEAPRPG